MSALPKGLIVAAPASGGGKTTATVLLLAALRGRGLDVRPFKSGPDYIDPAFHEAAAGRPSFNLDGWAMDRSRLAAILAEAAGGDLAVIEGAMGLFDGAAEKGAFSNGAVADLAAWTGYPVVLVLDARGQAQSVGAVALGCARLRDDVEIAGVVLNKVASPRHEALLCAGLDEAGVPRLGRLPQRADLALPSRHLGLVQAREQGGLDERFEALGREAADWLALDRLIAAARPAAITPRALPIAPPGQRIALARDDAFSFAYPHFLEGWRREGAEILPFSPLADQAPDPSADVAWLPGGYPELQAGRLAAAATFMSGLRQFAQTKPVHGECGGYMTLGAGLVDQDGARHEMAGLLGLETSFATRKLHLGYRRAVLARAIPGFAPGAALRGHEFHYATISAQPDPALAAVSDAKGAAVAETGSRRGLVSGSFFHLIAEDAP